MTCHKHGVGLRDLECMPVSHTHMPGPDEARHVAERLRPALDSGDPAAYADLLDDNVRWGGAEETPETCHGRAQVLAWLEAQRASGLRTQLVEVVPGGGAVLAVLNVARPVGGAGELHPRAHRLPGFHRARRAHR